MSEHRSSLVVTGIDGFVGRHVARAAKSMGLAVHGIGYAKDLESSVAQLVDTYVAADLTQEWPVTPPADAVIHLAALAAVGPSFSRPQEYISANSGMVTHMAETLLASGFRGTVLAVSSGAVYDASGGEPLTESSPVGMSSPYVVSKVLVENQLDYYRKRGLSAVIARPFNHIGPGQGRGFLVPDLCQQVREHDPLKPMPIGNLATSRDYLDVRDVASAYLTLVQSPSHRHLVYNVCSGVSVEGTEILRQICEAMGVAVPTTYADPTRYRPVDVEKITGSSTRLRDELGWEPRYSLAQSIADAVAYEATA